MKNKKKIKCLYCKKRIKNINDINIGGCKVFNKNKYEYWHEKCPIK